MGTDSDIATKVASDLGERASHAGASRLELDDVVEWRSRQLRHRRRMAGSLATLVLLGVGAMVVVVDHDRTTRVDTIAPPTTPQTPPSSDDLMLEPGPVPQPVDAAQARALQEGIIEMLTGGEQLPSLRGPFTAGAANASSFPGGGGTKSASVTAEGSNVTISVAYGTTGMASMPASDLPGSQPIDASSLPDGVLGATRETRRLDDEALLSTDVLLTSAQAPGFVLSVWTVGGGVSVDELLDLALAVHEQFPVTP